MVEEHLNKANMKWQHYPKIYFPLLTILVTIGGLFGTPVDEDIVDQLLSVNTPAEVHTSEELSITPSLSAVSSISTATGDWKPEFPHTGRSLAATVGMSIDNHETGLQSERMESVSEEASTSNKRLLKNLVTVQPTEMVSSYFVPFTRKAQAKHIDMISTKPRLMESSTGPTTEISSGDGKPAWHRELTAPMMSSTQSPISSVGLTLPSVPGNLPNSSVLDHALPVEMQLSTISSAHAESSADKFVLVEQTVTPGSESTNESTLPVFSIESTVAANASSITSALFMQLSTSWSSDSTRSPNNAQGIHWQATHASMDGYTTAPSSLGINDPSPDVSEDGHSIASSIGSNSLSSDVSEDMYSTAPSIGTNDPSLDVLEDVYSTTRPSIGTNWPSPDVSENMYSTATSSIGANYSSPDVSTASSIGSNWLSSDVSDMYSTATSIRTNYPSPNVAEDIYSISIGTNYQSSDVSDVYFTARSSIGSNWPSSDVSDDMYSTAPSSIGANYPSPDISEDVYSTPSSSIGTNWPPSVSEGEHYTSVATTWSSSTSVEISTALPYGQPSLGEDIATTSEFPGDLVYFSRTSSTPNFQPSVSGAESVSSTWEQSISEELSTSIDSTSYMAPQTSSIIGSYLKTSDPGMQLFTMVTTSGLEPEGSSLTIESSQTASYTHSSVIRNPLQLQFEILNQNYTDTLSNKSSEAYKELEAIVKATLDPMFSARYGDSFLETKILSFANGSVKVKSELVFQNDAVLPSSSDVVRTVLTHVYRKDLVPTDLEIDINSVVCNGYSVANLLPEKMTIEFTALSTGFGPWLDDSAFYPELLEHLKSLVVETLEEKYLVQEFDITRDIRIQGDVNILGTALLISSSVHMEALQLLTSLVNDSVDLRSLKVNGSGVNVGVLPISFLITNQKYNSTLRDSRSAYFCSLSKAVTRALQMILQPKYGHFVQAVIKQFGRGSVFVTSDLVFFNNPPSSHEVLDLFFSSVNSRSVLAGTDFAVDPYSFFVGGARLDRPYKRIHFPGFGIAIILLCGLAIVSLPILAFLCWKYRFCAACQKSFTFEAWDVERENASNIPLPEVNRESYRLREATYVNYSFNS